ncbi:MAG: VWA domain-containing protein [Hungatella sp.]|nr:VWA domain-containing protein [Hungatella sp.]
MRRKFNLTLFLACLAGGLVGCFLAGTIYTKKSQDFNPLILTGIYFAILSFSIGLAGVVSEWMTNHLKGRAWEAWETRMTLGLLFGATLLFFIMGAVFQFLYGLGRQQTAAGEAKDYIILIDNSGSTEKTDPKSQRFSAIMDFVDSLEPDRNVQVSIFDSENQIVFPLDNASKAKEKLGGILEQYGLGDNTDVQGALMDSLMQYGHSDRSAIAILLSDGISYVDVQDIADAYIESEIPIFTIGFSNIERDGRLILSGIAESTGGCFYDMKDLSELSFALSGILKYKTRRLLLDYRPGNDRSNVVYMVLRVLFLSLLGIGIGVPLIFMLDSEELILPAMIIRGIVSLIAGIVVERGLYHFLSPGLIRLIMCVCMALVVSFYRKQEAVDWTSGINIYKGKPQSSFYGSSGVGKKDSRFREESSVLDNEPSRRIRR